MTKTSYYAHQIDIVEVTKDDPDNDAYPVAGYYVQVDGVCEVGVTATLYDAQTEGALMVEQPWGTNNDPDMPWVSHADVNGYGQSYWTLHCDCDDCAS